MASRLSSPLVLAWLAFFPLLAWEGGIMGLAERPPEGPGGPRRLATAAAGKGASGGVHSPREANASVLEPLAGPTTIAQPARPAIRRLPGPPVPETPAPPYADLVEQFRHLGATYVRVERRHRGPQVDYLARCEVAGDGACRLAAQGDTPQAALDRLLAELQSRDVSPGPP